METIGWIIVIVGGLGSLWFFTRKPQDAVAWSWPSQVMTVAAAVPGLGAHLASGTSQRNRRGQGAARSPRRRTAPPTAAPDETSVFDKGVNEEIPSPVDLLADMGPFTPPSGEERIDNVTTGESPIQIPAVAGNNEHRVIELQVNDVRVGGDGYHEAVAGLTNIAMDLCRNIETYGSHAMQPADVHFRIETSRRVLEQLSKLTSHTVPVATPPTGYAPVTEG